MCFPSVAPMQLLNDSICLDTGRLWFSIPPLYVAPETKSISMIYCGMMLLSLCSWKFLNKCRLFALCF